MNKSKFTVSVAIVCVKMCTILQILMAIRQTHHSRHGREALTILPVRSFSSFTPADFRDPTCNSVSSRLNRLQAENSKFPLKTMEQKGRIRSHIDSEFSSPSV